MRTFPSLRVLDFSVESTLPMLELWQLWLNFKRAVRRRKTRDEALPDSPTLVVQPLEERRLLAVSAVADVAYSTTSSQLLVADDALGADSNAGNDGLLANDAGAASVASAGTFLSALGATVALNSDGTFTYDPGSSTSLQSLAPGALLDDAFTYTATDGQGNFTTAQAKIHVTGNHPPVLNETDAPPFTVVPRNEQDGIGASVASLQFFLAEGNAIPEGPAAIGIAVVGADSGDGRWQYSTDFGESWSDLDAASDELALLLDGDARVRLLPGPSVEQVSFAYRAWDLSQGASGDRFDASSSGGNSQFSAQVGTATGLVWTLEVSSPPTIDPGGRTELTFVLAAPVEGLFDVTIDWGDGTVQPLGQVPSGAHTVPHSYAGNPAAVEFTAASARIPILIEAVELISGDDGASTTLLTTASPGGAAIPLRPAGDAIVLPARNETALHLPSLDDEDASVLPPRNSPGQAGPGLAGPGLFGAGLFGAGLFGMGLVMGAEAQQSWKQRVDEAFESAEAARRLRRLRRRRNRDNSSS